MNMCMTKNNNFKTLHKTFSKTGFKVKKQFLFLAQWLASSIFLVSRWHLHALQTNRNHPNHLAWQNSSSWPLPYDISQQKCLLPSSSQKNASSSKHRDKTATKFVDSAKKEIVLNFLNSNIQHVSGHMQHGKTRWPPKMDTTVQAMLFSFWPIWKSA